MQGDGTAAESHWWQSWLEDIEEFLGLQTLKGLRKLGKVTRMPLIDP